MSNSNDKKKLKNMLITSLIVALCVAMILLDVIDIQYVQNERRNVWISTAIQQLCGILAVILLLNRLNLKLFGKIHGWLYLIPCMVIAIDNFPFCSYFNGNMQLVNAESWDFVWFAVYCMSVGLFEECVFRGIIFSVLAGYFSKDKKGFLKTYVGSSLVFGCAHLFNVFVGGGIAATLLQVGYTILTGGLFAFAFIKTQNVFCAAFIHALYNFCGLILSEQGIGSGIIFDSGTVITMLVVSVVVGSFVLYSVWKHPEKERIELYKRLGVEGIEAKEQVENLSEM